MNLAQFKTNIKHRLGHPVVNIELSTEQFDLCIDEAITYYQRNHFDGSEQIYMPVQVDSTIKTNRYITLSESVIGVRGIFDIMASNSSLLSTDFIMMADAAWQAFRSNGGLTSYYNMMGYRSLIQQTFSGKAPVRFNYNRGKVFIDMSDAKFEVGSWIVLDVQVAVDPAVDERMFKDPWLNDYATACVKKVWGQTLKKYQQVAMPGGIMLDGQTIFSEAHEEKMKLEDEVQSKWQLPLDMIVG